jgi:hypothetical protein
MWEDLMQNSVSTNLIASGFVVHYTAYMRTPFDAQHPQRQCFLSLLLLEVLGKDIWHLSCVLKLYKDDTAVLVKHAISMLRVSHLTHGNWCLTNQESCHSNNCHGRILRPTAGLATFQGKH